MSRPRPRRVVQLAGVAAAALLAGLLPGTDSAASGEPDGVSLAYTCQFGAGQDPQDISVGIKQAYPADGTVGKPIQPGDLTLTVGIPRAAVTALVPAEADTLSGSTDMKTNITQGTSRTVVIWPDLTAKSTTVAGSGDLDLVFTGKVPGVSVTAGGDLVFAAGDLDLTLHPQSAAGTPSDPGTPTADPSTPADSGTGGSSSDDSGAVSPSDISGNAPAGSGSGSGSGTVASGSAAGPLTDITGLCAAKAGQDITLGTVTVPGGTSSTPSSGTSTGATGKPGTPSGSPTSSTPAGGSPTGTRSTIVPLDASPPHSGRTTCDAAPKGELDPSRLPTPPPGAIVLPPAGVVYPDVLLCGYFTGFSNVNKLSGAMIVNDPRGTPALATLNSNRRLALNTSEDYYEVDSLLGIDLPSSHSTFLGFGFVPITADVNFVAEGPMTVVSSGDPQSGGIPQITIVGGYQDLRLSNVKVNGVSMNIGSGCHTATPLNVVLTGRQDEGLPGDDGRPDYTIQLGGPLVDGNLVIPPFTGCDTHDGDNLDALFTASLSGPGNTLNFVQAPLCSSTDAEYCDQPDIPLPQLPVRAGSTK
ncbi:hypothetical protein OG896_29380 [Streptomyces sp. NBC_00669]|uniref:DUF6801 domain-containing protein n=1 Tax=Streptomyces sp. NBC_00669 TaxID=2976011 RepID=UPI002E361515|nr:DUF6801 domain-containing protein [Streptomyces sp. NBC_00669]